jgi:hypothetical protein
MKSWLWSRERTITDQSSALSYAALQTMACQRIHQNTFWQLALYGSWFVPTI